jgi:hypothetical protein
MLRQVLLIATAAVCTTIAVSSRAAAQDVRSGDDAPIGWLVDLSYSSMLRAGAQNDCDNFRASARQVGATLTCDSTSRLPAWGIDGTLTFFRYAGLKIGYLDLGQINMRASAETQAVTGPFVMGSSFTQDEAFGHARGVTIVGVARIPLKRVVPFGELGMWRWSAASSSHLRVGNTVNAVLTGSDEHDAQTTERNWDPIVGGGVELWMTRYFAADAGVRLVMVRTASGLVDERFTSLSFGVKVGRR